MNNNKIINVYKFNRSGNMILKTIIHYELHIIITLLFM